ncbi:uncharacterized protein LOC109728253, partial [Ananas comosus]|uniref:Uncharacterized protein LOC109728253 n=1 Tax=Ananas comosus TaxID=4615 RepID=A0A6P5HHD7_ANACO
MVSDQEIASCVESLLRQTAVSSSAAAAAAAPATTVTVNGVVRQLEAKLGLDLSHKAAFIRDQIDLLLRPPKDHFALAPQFHHPHHFPHKFSHHPFPPPPASGR